MNHSLFTFAIVFLLLTSCRSPHRDPHLNSEWLTPVPLKKFNDPRESSIIRSDAIFEVPAMQRERAIAMLEKRAFVSLSSEQAHQLLGERVSGLAGQQLFLVRAVSQNLPGSFEAVYDRRELVVFYGAMGSRWGVLNKSPVVLVLSSVPKRVLVTTSVAK